MSKHTPGPWEWDGKYQVCIPHKDGVACFRTMPEDARLIVRAPELLEACKLALSALLASRGSDPTTKELEEIIAKAEGRPT